MHWGMVLIWLFCGFLLGASVMILPVSHLQAFRECRGIGDVAAAVSAFLIVRPHLLVYAVLFPYCWYKIAFDGDREWCLFIGTLPIAALFVYAISIAATKISKGA